MITADAGQPSAAMAPVSSAHTGRGTQAPPRPRVRARRGQATDPHSIAERLRRERIAERMKALQELLPSANKAGRFLGSAQNHLFMAETELVENVYSIKNEDRLSLLEQSMQPEPSNKAGLRFISGIICKSKELIFERMLFRTTRGNMFFNQAPAGEQVMDPVSGEMVHKTVFVVFFSGDQARSKILKIYQAFGANCYPVPEESNKQRQLAHEMNVERN